MSAHDAFRDGKVHVADAMCATCVFRPGNLMDLRAGRLRGMVQQAKRADSAIICHSTLGATGNAVCRGFYDRHAGDVFPLRLASAANRIEWQEVA
jgi:hypothetical protein